MDVSSERTYLIELVATSRFGANQCMTIKVDADSYRKAQIDAETLLRNLFKPGVSFELTSCEEV